MGCTKTVTASDFPKQGEFLNQRVKVCFHYDTTQTVGGRVVRNDTETPFETIIQLDDGRVVRSSECQYTID